MDSPATCPRHIRKWSRSTEATWRAHHGKEQSHGQVADCLTQLQREKEDLHARHLSLGERVDYLERLFGESAEKHAQELEKFKAKHSKDLDASSSKLQSHHAGLQERVSPVPALLSCSGNVRPAPREARIPGKQDGRLR
eukprot:Skav219679  [mRNA]  locus=scaffold817:23437:25194:- [translate_table: standard]